VKFVVCDIVGVTIRISKIDACSYFFRYNATGAIKPKEEWDNLQGEIKSDLQNNPKEIP